MAKNNQKKEKALRNRENAKKYRKKPSFGRRGREPRAGGNASPASAAPSA